jgi:hypothetical protein
MDFLHFPSYSLLSTRFLITRLALETLITPPHRPYDLSSHHLIQMGLLVPMWQDYCRTKYGIKLNNDHLLRINY